MSLEVMTPSFSRMTPHAARADALAHGSPDAEADLQEGAIVPPSLQMTRRVRPSAETLVERLRRIQMQGWSREEHHR